MRTAFLFSCSCRLMLLFVLVGCQASTQAPAPLSASGQMAGRVVKIADGDSFTLLDPQNRQIRVRLHGIDCPENGQPFGNKAKQYSSTLIFGKQVTVVVKNKDRYGRIIGLVQLADGTLLNERLLQQGMAWHYKAHYKNAAWTRMEDEARAAQKGLWSDAHPVAPWEWRKNKSDKR